MKLGGIPAVWVILDLALPDALDYNLHHPLATRIHVDRVGWELKVKADEVQQGGEG